MIYKWYIFCYTLIKYLGPFSKKEIVVVGERTTERRITENRVITFRKLGFESSWAIDSDVYSSEWYYLRRSLLG